MSAGSNALLNILSRTAAPSVFSVKSRLERFFANPRMPILRRLAPAEMVEFASLREQMPVVRYAEARSFWQLKALRVEHTGEPAPTAPPPREIPAELLDRFAMNGKAEIEYNYLDGTSPSNYPLIYTDAEIDHYIGIIAHNRTLPPAKQDWFIYGTLDAWICDALGKYPVRYQTVVNMGSMTPWYEAMLIHFGGKPTTIDYNPIVTRTKRMTFMTISDWERERPTFDVGFSISSFEHDGLGMYGDPLDPDGDLKAMRKMKERVKSGGLLFLAIPTGRDKVLFNNARIYGQHRLPLLFDGWDVVDTFGFHIDDLDGAGWSQPLYILRNS
jgi:Caenorhabditis protein of unknown function, DUF268